MGAEAIVSEPHASEGSEPEVIAAGDVAELVAPLPEVNLAAITAETKGPPPAEPASAAPEPAAVAPSAPDAPKAKPAPSRPAAVDIHGRPFDPLIHETTDDGQPIYNTGPKRAGTLRIRRAPLKEWKSKSNIGDAQGAPQAPPPADGAATPPPAPEAAPQPNAEMIAQQRKLAAQTIAGTQLALMRIALGPAVGAKEEEGAALIQAWEAVMAYHDVRTFNPWLAVVITSGGIVVGAMHHPETRSRFDRVAGWFKVRLYGLWLRVSGRRRQAQPDPSTAPPQPQPSRY